MFNLLVSADRQQWDGEIFDIEPDRFLSHTDEDIKNKFFSLSESNIANLLSLPCVFAYETGIKKDPKFGFVREIRKRQNSVRIKFEIIPVPDFLTYTMLEDMKHDLDILKLELYRTHWAVKNVDLYGELMRKGIHRPGTAERKKVIDITKHKFDVALSFPGEVRRIVEKVAEHLGEVLGENKCFYDNNYIAQLARPNLDLLLQNLYKNQASLVVVFLCEKYNEKMWCGLEFRAIRKILVDKEKENKVMFIRMDDGEVAGIFEVDGYVDGSVHSPKKIANFILERVELLSDIE